MEMFIKKLNRIFSSLTCKCGCGGRVKKGNKYIRWHHTEGKNNPFYGKHHTEESKKKQSKAKKEFFQNGGKTSGMKGKKQSDNAKKLISKANKGKILTQEHKDKISQALIGILKSEKHYKNVSIALTGKTWSEERKINWSIFIKGENNPNYGNKWSDIQKKRMSDKRTGTQILEKNPNWQGGKSFEPYGLEFNDDLREQVRKRDNYQCQECKLKMDDTDKQFHIHHIDYDKKNSKENNLILLCVSCHGKTGYNREYWGNKLTEINTRRY